MLPMLAGRAQSQQPGTDAAVTPNTRTTTHGESGRRLVRTRSEGFGGKAGSGPDTCPRAYAPTVTSSGENVSGSMHREATATIPIIRRWDVVLPAAARSIAFQAATRQQTPAHGSPSQVSLAVEQRSTLSLLANGVFGCSSTLHR